MLRVGPFAVSNGPRVSRGGAAWGPQVREAVLRKAGVLPELPPGKSYSVDAVSSTSMSQHRI